MGTFETLDALKGTFGTLAVSMGTFETLDALKGTLGTQAPSEC